MKEIYNFWPVISVYLGYYMGHIHNFGPVLSINWSNNLE